MIKINKLTVSYGKGLPNIIHDMSFDLKSGEILNILGQNAVGKTTLIKTLMKELNTYTGKIEIDGRNIQSYSVKEY